MSNYDLNGVHVLNKFIWASLRTGLGMTEADYRGLIPIIPTQQVPVFNDMPSGLPFLVYTFLVAGYDTSLWANVEQVTYRIFSDDERRLRQVTNYLVDLCKRYEWTAEDINDWVDNNPTLFPMDDDDQKVEFKFVQVVGATSPEPTGQEGGRQFSTVTIRMVFTHPVTNQIVGRNTGMRS